MGNIGAHRIVSTKLPSVGSTREAMTAAGNTMTRLLGTFQKVDYVFIVGVAGGIPHYTDYRKHVRLGDVVISNSNRNFLPDGYVVHTEIDKKKIVTETFPIKLCSCCVFAVIRKIRSQAFMFITVAMIVKLNIIIQ